MTGRSAIFWGALLAAVGVAVGAIGAHLLEEMLNPKQTEQFDTAVLYHLVHAIGLIAAGAIGVQSRSRCLAAAGWFFLAGILLFSGSLYGYVLSDSSLKFLVMIVPFGGFSFIIGWGLLAAHACCCWQANDPTPS